MIKKFDLDSSELFHMFDAGHYRFEIEVNEQDMITEILSGTWTNSWCTSEVRPLTEEELIKLKLRVINLWNFREEKIRKDLQGIFRTEDFAVDYGDAHPNFIMTLEDLLERTIYYVRTLTP